MEHLVEVKDVIRGVLDTLDKPLEGLTTGIKALDDVIGGLMPGELILIAGRPGMGKSALIGNIAVAASKEAPVIIFSLEMDTRSYIKRMIGSVAHVNTRSLYLGRLVRGSDEWERAEQAVKTLSKLDIIMDDSSSLTAAGIEQRLEYCIDMWPNLGCVMVDYLQLVDDERVESRQQEVADISKKMKSFARRWNIPAVVGCQLNRQAENEGLPKLSHLRESGALEQDADKVLMLHRPGYSEYTDDVDAQIIVAKQRNGPHGIVEVNWIKEYVTFVDKMQGDF